MFGITLSSAKLEVGMTLESIKESDTSESIKNKQIELFNKYNTTPDNVIDEDEFAVYEMDCRKKTLMIELGIVLAGGALFGLCRGFKYLKNLKNAKKLNNSVKKSVQASVKTATRRDIPSVHTNTPNSNVQQQPLAGQQPVRQPVARQPVAQQPVANVAHPTTKVTKINPENINFTYTSCGYRGAMSNSRQFRSIEGFLDFDNRMSTQFAKENGFYPIILKKQNMTGIMINGMTGTGGKWQDSRGGNITVWIDGILSEQQIRAFVKRLSGKFELDDWGRLDVNKKELAEIFNSLQNNL